MAGEVSEERIAHVFLSEAQVREVSSLSSHSSVFENQGTAHSDSGVLLFFPVCNRHQLGDTGSKPEDQEDSERHHDASGQTATMVA
jgi:hypothetical protein